MVQRDMIEGSEGTSLVILVSQGYVWALTIALLCSDCSMGYDRGFRGDLLIHSDFSGDAWALSMALARFRWFKGI